MTQHEQDEFARRFGDLEFTATPLTNIQRDGTLRSTEHDLSKSLRGNERWHHDSTYMPVQATGAVFTAEIVADEGGDTGFADMRAAYDALDDATRGRIDSLAAYHSRRYSMDRADLHVSDEDALRYRLYGYGIDIEPPLRPLVKVHPTTGRPNLLIGQHAHTIPGLTADESEALLDRLNDDACTPPRTYYHTWTKGDAVLWDNRCLMHRATPTIPGSPDGCGTPGSPETRRPKPVLTTDHSPTRPECPGLTGWGTGRARGGGSGKHSTGSGAAAGIAMTKSEQCCLPAAFWERMTTSGQDQTPPRTYRINETKVPVSWSAASAMMLVSGSSACLALGQPAVAGGEGS